jgi:hypothetical protein
MSVQIDSTAAGDTLADMSLEDALDELGNVDAYLARVLPEVTRAQKARTDLRTVIALRLEERGARRFERGVWRARFETVKRGSAAVHEPAALRKMLMQIPDVPQAAIDEALPEITPPVAVKPNLRLVRKLADYGSKIRAIVRAHIVEAQEFENLVIEPIELNVTPATDAIEGER